MSQQFDAILRGLKLKITPKRRAILEILAGEGGYASPEEVWHKLKHRFDRVGLPTVYRNLEELASGGAISKIIHPNRQLYYYYCGNREHHHHFVCLSCRRVEDVAFCALAELEKAVAGRIVSHVFQANGYCRECSQNREDSLCDVG